MTARFDGLTAIVTGGASGIGASVSHHLVREGGAVAILDRDVSAIPDSTRGFAADVTDDDAVRSAVSGAATEFGGIDIVVNCAGIGAQGTIEANSDDEWHWVFDVNVLGAVRVARAALPHLRKSMHAAVVNVGSVVATTGIPSRALYSATKGALVALTRAMAVDHLDDGIRVNCVSPGTVDTPWVGRLLSGAGDPGRARSALEARQPHGRLVTANEVAAAVVYLADPRSGSTNGIVLAVDGGLGAIQRAR